ncbi:MAG: 4'-phosphopantetheinyl transferase superfamily protein [Candidatus Omnitrophota bacterium]
MSRSPQEKNTPGWILRGRPKTLHGIGIDIVSRSRMKKFLSRHREMILRRFLNSREREQFSEIRLTRLAELFTAKEAFFKACNEPWMGLEGFQGMRITKRIGDYFEMEWRVAGTRRCYRGDGSFFRDGDLVGAQTMIWS